MSEATCVCIKAARQTGMLLRLCVSRLEAQSPQSL